MVASLLSENTLSYFTTQLWWYLLSLLPGFLFLSEKQLEDSSAKYQALRQY